MSRSSSNSIRRRPSDDPWPGKRTAEDDEAPSLSEPQKRVRRDGSSPQNEEDPTQDVIAGASQRSTRRSETQREADNRVATSSQPSSCLSSPLSSAPSRLTEDCGEMAQRAMETWQSTLVSTNSESNRQELLPGSQGSSNEARTTLQPRSPGNAPGESNQSRDWLQGVNTSAERQFRTPLPTQKEPRLLDASPSSSDNSHARVEDNAQTQSTGVRSQTQPANAIQRAINGDYSDQQPVEHRVAVKDSVQLIVRDAPVWHTGGEIRSLPPLPSMSAQFPTLPRPHEHQSPGLAHNTKGLEGGLNTFPSTFSVLTSEEVQRNHASTNRGGRRREHFSSRPDTRLEDYQERPSPRFRDTVLQPGISRRPVSSASTAPQIYHTIQPQRPSTPPTIMAQNASFQPPPVIFTINNRAESSLQTPEIQPFVTSFTQNTSVLLPVPPSDKDASSHPITVMLWQTLSDFYKWYAQSAKVQEVGPLMFELIDVHWQEEKSFVVPEGSLNYFRTIKQYIWDLYWLAVDINKGHGMFRVLITPFSPRGEMSPHKQEARWNPVNSGILNSPRSIHHSDQQGHVILESTPGPLYAHQRRLSGQSPSLPNSAARTRPVTSHRQHENSTMNNSARLDSGLRRNSFEPNHAAHEAGSQQSQRPHSLPSSSPHMGSTRTTRDQAMLRERASAYLIDRRDLELLSQESTVLDKLPYKTGAEVCGVVVDRRSGKGMVAITGKGYITLNVKTGPDESGDRYQDIAVQPKQTCMLHGEAVVLFYKRRQIQPEPPPQPPPFPSENHSQLQRPSTASDVDIIIRLQMDGSGKYSPAFDKSVLRPNRITTIEFFSWFASQSGHCPPQGPPYLKFTFKDAMPAPTSTEIVRGNEDHFNYMRKDIKIQCEKAKKYMADVKEFVILVTVPGWNTIDEEEEW